MGLKWNRMMAQGKIANNAFVLYHGNGAKPAGND
jgi:hypothetical protein